MSLLIAGMGTAVPRHAIAQRDALEIVKTMCCETDDQRRLLPALFRRSGVGSRHSILLQASEGPISERQSFYAAPLPDNARGPSTAERMARYTQEVGDLACRAASQALERADVKGGSITHLVTVSCSGFSAPGVELELVNTLGLPKTVARSHVGFMGCHGAMNGLRIARAFSDADPRARVLLCATELCTLHFRYGWDPEAIVSNALFSDGAAAVVGFNPEANASLGKHAQPGAWRLVANGSTLIPETRDAMTWTIGNHGFEMTLSSQVPELIVRHLKPWLEQWLAEHGLTIDRVGTWAVHPGGPRILSACCEGVGLDPVELKTSQDVLAEFGNMSSPTILFILDRLQQGGAPRPCVALGFGPGLAIEAALFA